MKKSFIILMLTITVILVILSSIVFARTRQNEEATLEEKVVQELNYLNKYCISLLTNLNGISIETNVIQENNLQTQFGISTNKGTESSRSIMNNQQGNDENSADNNKNDNKNNQTQDSILSNEGNYNPNWEDIQIQIERLYQIWNTISLDLHSINVDSNLVLSFSDYLNNATQSVKKRDKANTINEVAKMYNLVIEYTKRCKPASEETTILTILYNVVSAYANITNDKWEDAEANIIEAQTTFTSLLNTVNSNYNQEINLNRSYILVNELKKAIKIQDKEIFFLQYKTLITQLYLVID